MSNVIQFPEHKSLLRQYVESLDKNTKTDQERKEMWQTLQANGYTRHDLFLAIDNYVSQS